MRKTMLPEGDPGRGVFLPMVRKEAAGSRPTAKKKAPPPKGQRQRVQIGREQNTALLGLNVHAGRSGDV